MYFVPLLELQDEKEVFDTNQVDTSNVSGSAALLQKLATWECPAEGR